MNEEMQQGYMLYLDKIVEDGSDLPTYLVRAGKELQQCGYLTAGDFFERLDDVEVLHLTTLMNSVHTADFRLYSVDSEEAGKSLYHLSLVCFLLALGEGEVQITPEFLHESMKALFILIAVENLYREGKVLVFRENFTILESKRPVAQVIKGQI
jgi:hypothetical protein